LSGFVSTVRLRNTTHPAMTKLQHMHCTSPEYI